MKKRMIGIVLIVCSILAFSVGIYNIRHNNKQLGSYEWAEFHSNNFAHYRIRSSVIRSDLFGQNNKGKWEDILKYIDSKEDFSKIDEYIRKRFNTDSHRYKLFSIDERNGIKSLTVGVERKREKEEKYDGERLTLFLLNKPSTLYFETRFTNGYKANYTYSLKSYDGEVIYKSSELDRPFCDSVELQPGLYYEEVNIIRETGSIKENMFLESIIFIK